MIDITSTRTNHLVDPSVHVWAWQIPVYLFLGGLVAGMMAISGWFLFKDRHQRADSVAFLLPALSLVVLSLGMGALFLDLEHKLYFWRLYTTFQIASPMSWGAWILLAVYPALVGALLLRLPLPLRARWRVLDDAAARLSAWPPARRLVAGANLTLGASLGLYTGVLLSSLGARPLWSSAILAPLFLVSGLSSAAALVHMVARERDESEFLARADNRLLLVELVVLGLFLIGMTTSTRVHADAAALLMGGRYTAAFWVGVVGIGIVIPLFIQTLAVGHRVRHTAVAPLLVLAGGLLLRFVVVYAGQYSHWSPA